MERLWKSIIIMCSAHGKVNGLNALAECLGLDAGEAYRSLIRIKLRDKRLRVVHRGRGCKMDISYNFNNFPEEIKIDQRKSRVITFKREELYRGLHGPDQLERPTHTG